MIYYTVTIPKPLSVNHIYATAKTGRRFMTNTHLDLKTGKMIEGGKQYAGYWKETKSRGKEFVPGRLDGYFRGCCLPRFTQKTKVVVEAYAVWPDNRARDLGNLEKPVLDALQNGGFIPNDSYALWRAMDFRFEPGVHQLVLRIYELEENQKQLEAQTETTKQEGQGTLYDLRGLRDAEVLRRMRG